MPLSNEPDPYSMERYNTKFQVMLGHQPHNARQVVKHAKTIGRFQDMYRVPLKKDKILDIMRKTGYVEHAGRLIKKSRATKVRKEAARELLLRQGKPIVGVTNATRELERLVLAARNHRAADRTMPEQIRRLVRAGASVRTARDEAGQPLLFEALEYGLWNTAMALIEYGADVRVRSGGETPLHMAASQVRVVSKIIEKGGDVNALDGNGVTALEIALVENTPRVVDLLLRKGAKPQLVNISRVMKRLRDDHGNVIPQNILNRVEKIRA